MNDETTRPSLLERLRDPQDHDAWRVFEARYSSLLVGYARRLGLQPADAEDVRQLVLMNLVNAMKSFRYDPRRGRFRSYLGMTVQHAVARHLARRGEKEVPLGLAGEDGPACRDHDLDQVWLEEWRRHHFQRAFAASATSHDPRTIRIFERLLEGSSVEAVARETGTSADAVYKIKQRIRAELRERIARQIAEEDG